ncbi:unnamed protein product, partial [Mesorhabditis spiculigera]
MSAQPLALGAPTRGRDDDRDVLVDALPYLDVNYSETDRQFALGLIEQECKSFPATKNYLKHLPIPDYDAYLTPALLEDRKLRTQKVEIPKPIDLTRCDLPCPAGTSRSNDKLFRNAFTQNEHLRLRQINLELMEEYGPEASRRWSEELQAYLRELENDLRQTQESVMEVHASRKHAQMSAGKTLKELENAWVQMVTKNYRMEMTNQQLEAELKKKAKEMGVDYAQLGKS